MLLAPNTAAVAAVGTPPLQFVPVFQTLFVVPFQVVWACMGAASTRKRPSEMAAEKSADLKMRRMVSERLIAQIMQQALRLEVIDRKIVP